MSDDEKTVEAVNAVYPVTMNRVRRIEPFGAEERYLSYKSTKKPVKQKIKKQGSEKCTITAEKVDCKV